MKNQDTVTIKRFTNIRFEIIVNRRDRFWQGVTSESVGKYLKELKTDKNSLQKAFNIVDSPFDLNSDYIEKYTNAINNEIELCEFYFELKKKKKDKDFNEWVFFTEEEQNKGIEDSWRKKQGEAWIKSNGRVKATISISDNIATKKVALLIENDSKILTYQERKEREVSSSNLRNEESIKKKIEELKKEADERLSKEIIPYYCSERGQYDIMLELLGGE